MPALAALRDPVRPPDGMTAIELGDGRCVFAPAGTSPAEVNPAITTWAAVEGLDGVVVEGSGHFLQWEQAEVLNQALIYFFADLRG